MDVNNRPALLGDDRPFHPRLEAQSYCIQCSPPESDATSLGILEETKKIFKIFGIESRTVSAMVSDTEATMTKFGQMLAEELQTDWIPCVDHVLELAPKQLFKLEQFKEARKLVWHYNASASDKSALNLLQFSLQKHL